MFINEIAVASFENTLVKVIARSAAAGAFVGNGEANVSTLENTWNENRKKTITGKNDTGDGFFVHKKIAKKAPCGKVLTGGIFGAEI